MDYGGYTIDTEDNHGLSNKQLAVIFGSAVVGIIIFFALFLFPVKNLFPESVTEQVTIISKNDGQCVVNSKDHPRGIPDCEYNVGDKLEITYKYGTTQIEKYTKIN